MISANTPLQRFFLAFSELSSSGDIPAIVAQFADPFLAVGPQGAKCVRAADFAAALPGRKQFFESLGCRSTSLVSVEEIPLDTRYVLAKTRWRMVCAPQQGESQEIFGDTAYLVDAGQQDFKILLYLASHDFMQELKERGILNHS
jgi:hypothetical protein